MVEYIREEKYTPPKDVKELLTIALEKEKSSYGFYEDMLNKRIALSVKDLIKELRDAEAAHIKAIKARLASLKPPFEA